jgi:hypothetical protein
MATRPSARRRYVRGRRIGRQRRHRPRSQLPRNAVRFDVASLGLAAWERPTRTRLRKTVMCRLQP